MALVGGLDAAAYSPRCYVVAATDKMSGQKADVFEAGLAAAAPAAAGADTAAEGAAAAGGGSPAPAGEASPGVQTRRAAAQHRRNLAAAQQGESKEPGRLGQSDTQREPARRPYNVVRIPRSRWVRRVRPPPAPHCARPRTAPDRRTASGDVAPQVL